MLGYVFGPEGNKGFLRDASVSQVSLPVLPGKLGILIHETLGGISVAGIDEEWNDLGDLPTVVVVWEHERSYLHIDELGVLLAGNV